MRLRTILIALVFLAATAFASPYLLRAGKWVIAFNKGIERSAESQKKNAPGPDALTPEEAKKIYLSPGNPSNADPSTPDNFLLTNSAYTLSYNNRKGHRQLGGLAADERRHGRSRAAKRFPARPAAARRVDEHRSARLFFKRLRARPSLPERRPLFQPRELNSETFLMTNIAPAGPRAERRPVGKARAVFAQHGPPRREPLYNRRASTATKGKIDGKITIPSNFWKVIVVIENGGDISSADANTRVIAVDMPNENGIIDRNWREFTVTVRSIEEKTGYDLLSNLPRKLQDALETKVDPRSEK